MSNVCEGSIQQMKAMGNPQDLAGKARFGINIDNALGLRTPQIRALAKDIIRENDRDHTLEHFH